MQIKTATVNTKSVVRNVVAAKTSQTTARATRSPNSDEVARKAFEIYEREGRQEGCALEHWLRAEAELRGSA